MPEPDSLYETIAAVLRIEPTDLSEDSSPETIASWDSVNHLNLVMALESEFGIRLSPDDALAMRTVGAAREIVRRRGVNL